MQNCCFVCKKQLEIFNEEYRQPYEGGEVQINFAFGSRHDQLLDFASRDDHFKPKNKLGQLMASEVITGYICDDCFEDRVDYFSGYKIQQKKYIKTI